MDDFYDVINVELTASCTGIVFALHIFDALLTNYPLFSFLREYAMCSRCF